MSIISSGIVTIAAGVTSSNLEVIQEGALHILESGQANEIMLADGGTAVVSSGGSMCVCTISSGGMATVLEEAYVEDVTVEEGGLCLMSGGIAFHSIVKSGGTQILKGGDAFTRGSVIMAGGVLQVSNDCSVSQTTVYGTVEVTSGMANNLTMLEGGVLTIGNGYAMTTTVSSGGSLVLGAEGLGQNVSLYDGGCVVVSSGAYTRSVKNSGGRMVVENGGAADTTTVKSGRLVVSSGGIATKVTWTPCEGIVEIADGASVTFAKQLSGVYYGSGNKLLSSAKTMASKTLGSMESMCIMSGGVVNSASVEAGGGLFLYDGGKIRGTMRFDSEADVSAGRSAVFDFDLTQTSAGAEVLVNDLSVVRGTPLYTLTVSDSMEEGVYALADGAAGFSSTISVFDSGSAALGSLAVGETIQVGDADYTLNLTDSLLSLSVVLPPVVPTNLVGTPDKVSWDPTGAAGYIVEYSTDDFKSVLQTATPGAAVDMYELPAGTYQWRVKADDGEEWAVGDAIVSEPEPEPAAKAVTSNEDGNSDLFFASTDGSWDRTYFAMHVGSVNDWTGTNEIISANGRGRIQNLFFGSADPNVLCLTDGENGDAIFVDDAYTELPEEIETNTARLYRIQEIRAGAGDDIVDMTSQQFEYTGDGLTIRGGDGDDILWANKGDNFLSGDAGNDRIVGASGNDVMAGGIGNDRMHGGGGNDVFTFCDNWGTDTVRQLESGTVTLWFASGDIENWNPETMTYTNGTNSVTVSGLTADKVTLKFGDDGSEEFASLASAGAFLELTSEKIFEESGILAGV